MAASLSDEAPKESQFQHLGIPPNHHQIAPLIRSDCPGTKRPWVDKTEFPRNISPKVRSFEDINRSDQACPLCCLKSEDVMHAHVHRRAVAGVDPLRKSAPSV
jgi:hypothetical protein